MKKMLIISCFHGFVFIIIRLLSFSTIINMLRWFSVSFRVDHSEKYALRLANYYDGIISLSLFKMPSCLERALMMTFFMNMRNIPTEFCLGVARSEGKLMAHAWLTYKGKVLGKEFPVDEFVKVFSSIKINSLEVYRKL